MLSLVVGPPASHFERPGWRCRNWDPSTCYGHDMRAVEALYENGLLKPTRPLKLRQGERVGLIVVRHPDAARWDLKRLAQSSAEDETLAASGVDAWADALEVEDRR